MDLEARYELLDKIGSGSFATVFRARDAELGREVAVKQIHAQYMEDAGYLAKYWQEAQMLASFQHPNIVTIYDIFRERGWLILELMQASLASRMAGRPMELSSLRATLVHALRALQHLHERGVIHSDIKPGNLMIDSRRRIRVGDFGLARRASDEEGSLIKATPKYMSPEMVSPEFGEVCAASDLYSLGFSAYELMCGPNFETLFPGLSAFGRNKQAAWMMWHAAADRRLPEIRRVLTGVPEDLAHVIQKLCEKDQARRYRSAEEALADLNAETSESRAAGEGRGPASLPAAGEQPPAIADRKRRTIALAALAASFVLSLLVLWLPSGSGPAPRAGASFGVIREVLTREHRLVVEDIETGKPEEIVLADKPEIYLENAGQYVMLRDLQPGDRVEFHAAGAGPVAQLTADRPVSSSGRIAEIDLDTRRLIVSVDEGDYRGDLPLRVPPRAELKSVLLNGEPVKLHELREGDRVEVRHLSAVGTAEGRVVDRLEARRLYEAAGFISEFDVVRGRLTVQFGLGAAAQKLVLPIAEDCQIRLLGDASRTLAQSDLRKQDRVRFRYDTQFRELVVSPSKLQASGRIREIREPSRQLVVLADDARELRFHVPDSCDVTLGSEPAELADLRADDRADVTYAEGTDLPEAVTIDAVRNVRKDRWAVIIGAGGYQDRALTPVKHARRDARLIESVLLKRYAFSEDRLRLLLDPTRQRMERELTDVLSAARGPTQVFVCVHAHAFRGEDGRGYIAGSDFAVDRMAETGLPLAWLIEQLEACASADKLLLLDTCHPQPGIALDRQPAPDELLAEASRTLKTTAVISACSRGQRGLESADADHGLFAHVLAEALAGKADQNADLHIPPSELFDFLQVQIPRAAQAAGGSQTPVLLGPRR